MDNKLGIPSMVSLNARNYSTWRTHIEDILNVNELYKPIINEKIPTCVQFTLIKCLCSLEEKLLQLAKFTPIKMDSIC